MCIDNYNILSNTVLLVEEGLGVAVCLNGDLAIHHSPQLRFVPLVPERSIRGVLIWCSGMGKAKDTSRVTAPGRRAGCHSKAALRGADRAFFRGPFEPDNDRKANSV